MATWVLSECGLKPLAPVFPKPRTGFFVSNNSKVQFLGTNKGVKDLKLQFQPKSFNFKEKTKWGLNVSTPLRIDSIQQEHEQEQELPQFDPGSPPPFTLADIRAAIPKHCWVKDSWKSMSYVLRDVLIVFGLAAVAAYLNNWIVWPLYWAAQGTMFWALFVLGHDCGHGSFSSDPKLNSVVGHLLHSSILVPYHGWRISHRTHHQHHGHVENDESWHPLTEKIFKSLDNVTRSLRFTSPFPLLAYPVYLWARSPGKTGSHFNPSSDLFVPNEKKDVITSTACWFSMVAILVGLGFAMGPIKLLMLYGIPYIINVMWLDLVTYLHHHGHEDKLPWYRGKVRYGCTDWTTTMLFGLLMFPFSQISTVGSKLYFDPIVEEWSYLRGGLTTIDRDYGWINNIHHDIGTHVVHHLFPQIPHYHLVEATKAARPVFGDYYKEPKKSAPLPFHLIGEFIRSLKRDHYVSDTGDVVYYQTDPKINGSAKSE